MSLLPMQFDPMYEKPPMMASPTPTIDGRTGGDMLPVPTGFDPAVHPGGGEMPLVPMQLDPTDEMPPMMGAPAIPLLGIFLARRHRPRAVNRPVPRDGRDVEILRQQFQEMGLRRRRKRSCFSHEEEEEGLVRSKKGRAKLVEEALILADEEELPTSFTMLEISAGGGSSSPALSALEELVAGMLAGTTITQKSPMAPANRGELSAVDADEPIMLYEFTGLNIVEGEEEEGTLKDWDVVVPGRDEQPPPPPPAAAAAAEPDVWDGYDCIDWAAALFDHPDAW